MGLKHDDGWNIPTDSPFYPSLPAIYRNVKFQYVFFHADPAAVQELLPEPLQATEDGLCVAAGIDVPFCTNYGAISRILCRDALSVQKSGWFLLFPRFS